MHISSYIVDNHLKLMKLLLSLFVGEKLKNGPPKKGLKHVCFWTREPGIDGKRKKHTYLPAVEGKNPAPANTWVIPLLFTPFYTSQVLQDFFHQQYLPNETIVGGFNSSEKHESNWIISPGFRGEIKNV